MSEQDVQHVRLTIDGVPLEVPRGTLLVEAAKQIKQEIPVYCYHTKLGPAGLCRVCLVDIEGMPKLQIACNTPVSDGMVVHTRNAKTEAGRRSILELLLVNHPLDCPICDKGGECDLQDYAMAYARGSSDVVDPKSSKPKGVDLGPTIVLDEERCVVCQRCVRFDDIIAKERQLVVKDRGARDMIATATGIEYRHNFTGNVTELCPVGALTSKTYRFKSRPWDLTRTQTSCTQCAVGCQMFSDVRFGTALRTMSVEHDDAISDGWLCDRGRYNIGFYTSNERITQPLYKRGDRFVQIGWDDAFTLWSKAITDALASSGAQSVGTIGGGRLTNEEAYVLQHLFRARGMENLDWRAGRQRQATPGALGGDFVALERARTIVLAGESPEERAPVMWLRILKAISHGARLIRIAPIEAAPAVECHDVANIAEAVKLAHADGGLALVWDGVDLALGRDLAAAFAARADVLGYIAGEQGNARGAEAMGMLPRAGALDTRAMLAAANAGQIAVLSLFGVNPLLHLPQAGVRDALQRVPFLVVSEMFMTETAQLATLVLPAKGAFEKSGTTMNLIGDLLPVAASLQAPDGILSDLEILVGLAQQLDTTLPREEEVHAEVIAAAAARNTHGFGDERYGGNTRAAESSDVLRVTVRAMSFAGGGTSAHDERIATLRPLPQAAFSVDDARRFGIKNGDRVDLQHEHTSVRDLVAAVLPELANGTVALVGGMPEAPVNGLDGQRVQVANVRAGAASPVAVEA